MRPPDCVHCTIYMSWPGHIFCRSGLDFMLITEWRLPPPPLPRGGTRILECGSEFKRDGPFWHFQILLGPKIRVVSITFSSRDNLTLCWSTISATCHLTICKHLIFTNFVLDFRSCWLSFLLLLDQFDVLFFQNLRSC